MFLSCPGSVIGKMRKLTNVVDEIRASDESTAELARRYGVTYQAVRNIQGGFAYAKGTPPERRKTIGRPRKPRPLCECGCGEPVRATNTRFIGNHSFRMPEINAVRMRNLDRTVSPEKWLANTLANTQEEYHGLDTPCMIWQGGSVIAEGYPITTYRRNGKPFTTTRHRRVYEIANDVQLDYRLHVDHICNQRMCMNPEHLQPLTPTENVQRGTSTMTPTKVRELRRLKAEGWKIKALAERFGISTGNVRLINNGVRWGNVK